MSEKIALEYELDPQHRSKIEELKKAGGFIDDQALFDAAIEAWKVVFRLAQADIGVAAMDFANFARYDLEMPALKTARENAKQRRSASGTPYIQ